MKRRSFLDSLLWAAGATLAGMTLYPLIRYLIPPRLPEAPTRTVKAASRSEIPENAAKIFPFGAEPGILIHTAEGEHRAFSAVCTHLQCTVQYRSDRQDIWCACHDGIYDLEGRNISGPPPRPLEPFIVHYAGEDILVERKARA